MRRQEFIALLGGVAMAWPLIAHAQQASTVRKLGIPENFLSDDIEGQARLKNFGSAMQKLGWTEGRNLHTEIRWAGDDAERYRFVLARPAIEVWQ